MTERVLGPTGGSNRRRTRLLTVVALIGALATIFFVAASSATLTGSTFDTANGTLTDSTDNDWNPAGSPANNVGPVETINCTSTPTVNCGVDLVNNSNDNAFGQGAKEDDESPTVVTGSIPPNKDDLSRFYVNKQRRSSKDFLYLAWERSNLLGSAHMDFEFNQKFCDPSKNPTNCSGNGVTPLRTAGDLLIDFDFGGSGPVGLSKHTWITSGSGGSAGNCEASNSLPCWDKGVGFGSLAEASVNRVDVTDYNQPDAPRTLDGETKQTGQTETVSSEFGEAGINLTDSGVFPQDQCVNFGSASLKSRSAGSSFNSELKDFIAPIPVNISNCGAIKIIKRTYPTRGVDKTFSFTSTLSNPANPTTSSSPYCQQDTSPSAFTLNDKDNTNSDSTGNTENCVNVLAGIYSVTEGAPGTGWTLKSITCTVTGSGGSSGAADGVNPLKANIDLKVGDLVTCVFLNEQQLGAIKITKTSSKTGNNLAGAKFRVCTNNGPYDSSNPCTPAKTGSDDLTTAAGAVCIDNLAFGDYYVSEKSAPTGFAIDDSTVTKVTVDNNASCGDSTYVGESKAYTDTPLADIQVRFRDGGSGETKLDGAATAALTCDNSTGTSDRTDTTNWDDTLTVSGIKVTSSKVTVVCTILIDP